MTTEPTEGWLTRRRDQLSGIPAVSVAECDRRVKAERDRCTAWVQWYKQGPFSICDLIAARIESGEPA